MTARTERIPVAEGFEHFFGRHVHHDEASKAYPAALAPSYQTVWWPHQGPVLYQGNLGSCTGNALVDCLMSGPLYRKGRNLTEADAITAYSRATQLDPWPGEYPPSDTGSDGLDAVSGAGVEFGWLKGYTHAFGLDACLRALTLQPVMIGIPWYRSMMSPPRSGILSVSGDVVGGHEVALTAITQSGMVRILNSWSASWGVSGTAFLRFPDLARLLNENGDVTCPVSV